MSSYASSSSSSSTTTAYPPGLGLGAWRTPSSIPRAKRAASPARNFPYASRAPPPERAPPVSIYTSRHSAAQQPPRTLGDDEWLFREPIQLVPAIEERPTRSTPASVTAASFDTPPPPPSPQSHLPPPRSHRSGASGHRPAYTMQVQPQSTRTQEAKERDLARVVANILLNRAYPVGRPRSGPKTGYVRSGLSRVVSVGC
ncbi:hypothetical protein PLICRDRAFT_41152 [Plicaturopsis crispa FD-325 SS-3]|nr:hypothetical protein PLICRDRAFT_41152 [Plicaturopsis crispa FD-325 SS-3]